MTVSAISLLALFPLSVQVADPLFSRPYEARFEVPVLLVFPEHIEVRWIHKVDEVAPPPKGTFYTFAIPRDRQRWVEQQIQALAPPRPGSAWRLRVRQLKGNTQRIELEADRDGFTGFIYDVRQASVTPIAYRRAGPGAALVYLLIDVGFSCALSIVVWIAMNLRPKKQILRLPPPS